MTQSTQDSSIWTATGTVTPLTAGTLTILFTAVDNGGATATTSLPAVVNTVSP